MELKLSKQITKTNKLFGHKPKNVNLGMGIKLSGTGSNANDISQLSEVQVNSSKRWNHIYVYVIYFIAFIFLVGGVVKLQVVDGAELYRKSSNNYLHERTVYPARGIITDRNGVVLAENVASYNVFIIPDEFFDSNQEINESKLKSSMDITQKILGDKWHDYAAVPSIEIPESPREYPDLYSVALEKLKKFSYFQSLLILSDINNDEAIAIKAKSNELKGMYVDDSTKRHYPGGIEFSQILGYTSKVTGDDLKISPNLDPNEEVGRSGVENTYNDELSGEKGKVAIETDSSFNIVSDLQMDISKVKPGSSVSLTIDSNAQKTLYNAIVSGVDRIGAHGASGIVQDIHTGEILAMVSYPTFDNNAFIGGISTKDYKALVENPDLPLFNRPIASQQPPGSIFKTIVGASAIDAGKLDESTQYFSSASYRFSNNATFYEYGQRGYGWINVITAYEVSSNIFFCETIRNWDMDQLDIYLDKFGIGKVTGIDLPGEMPGRLPSPANKIMLAKTSPWLESVWYPEGDSCNSVIGQGITSVTPLQAVNWTSAIANGGTLFTPHVVKDIKNDDGTITEVNPEPQQKNIVSQQALDVVRRGMRETLTGPRNFLTWSFWDAKYNLAAKTGTAEFGALNADGHYEHTHAWTIAFYPYENPKFAVVVLLEDSQKGINSATVIDDFINNYKFEE